MFCKECGMNLTERMKFCPNCGTSTVQVTAQRVPDELETLPGGENNDIGVLDKLKLMLKPEYVKYGTLGLYALMLMSALFAWLKSSTKYTNFSLDKDSSAKANLFGTIFTIENVLGEKSFIISALAVVAFLVTIAAIAFHVLKMFDIIKLPIIIPKIILLAVPALICFVYIILSGPIGRSVMTEVFTLTHSGIRPSDLEVDISVGAGFGPWLIMILSALHTALYAFVLRDKSKSLLEE